ncbi:MAG: glycosyltransferase [Chitinophagia bacterium]|nr:glycosyltransferase [Chitinophagia bacterium]
MLITIITATFDSARTVDDTLRSVHAQTYPDIEHIIVDGASTDKTLSIVANYPQIRKVVSEPDMGIYDAMNKGIALASGDVVGILNSDDFYAHPDVLHKVVAAFEDPSVDAVYGDLLYVDAENPRRVLRSWKSGRYRPGRFKWGWMPPHPTFFVRRTLYERYGGFNLALGTCGDYELMLRFIHRHGARLSYLPEVLVLMRAGGASNESLLARLQANRNDRLAWSVNGIKPFWFTLYLKPLRKFIQFLRFRR